MASVIDQIIFPRLLGTLREDIPPVQCIIWKGGKSYETITFDNIYPFDTIDTIKRMLCAKDPSLIPRFTFVGVPINDPYSDQHPNLNETYIPINYLWYPSGTNDIVKTYILNHPVKTLSEPDLRFVSNGSYASPNYEVRGRSSIEQVFLKPREKQIPTFHVFPLSLLLEHYKGKKPVSEEDWYKRFAPYFPEVEVKGPFEPEEEDIAYAKKIKYYISKRITTLDYLNELAALDELPRLKVSGIRQLLLLWKKPIREFEGSANLFYEVHATDQLPYLRLYPAEGNAITKLHVKGILPIPTLEDPRILESWGKEVSPTPGSDFCSMKYVHRPSIGITQPIYGTIHAYNDGTMKLMLQPPKQIRKLDPNVDFRHFNRIIEGIFQELPQEFDQYQLKELAVFFSMKIELSAKKFTKKRIQQRLSYFHTVFKEITPLPGDNPLIALRYKAVSQYASEDKIFTFITQTVTEKEKEIGMEVVEAIQEEFDLSKQEALDIFAEWIDKSGEFTVQLPEEGEFMESFNPGIDIYIHAQHPSYHFHIHRIDSNETYQRIYTLLSILFLENDDYFPYLSNASMANLEEEMEEESLKAEVFDQESTAASSSMHNMEPDMGHTALDFDPLADIGEVIPETAPHPLEAAVVPKKSRKVVIEEPKKHFEEQKVIDPSSWFIGKLQEMDPNLFGSKASADGDRGYSSKCQSVDDRQPAVLTQDQYDRMREIYAEDPIFWIVYPLDGQDDPIQPIGTKDTITIMRYGYDTDSIRYYFCPHYFCLSDEIMIRATNFESDVDRDGNPKPPDSCPFCHGKLITNKKKAIPGYTVIKRKNKPLKPHINPGFLKTTSHPEGFALPCCFTMQKTTRVSDPQFAHLRAILQQEELENLGIQQEEDEEEDDALVYQATGAVAYRVLFEEIHKKYILESNKEPGPGAFAILTPTFDTFFRQNSSDQMVARVAIVLNLRPNAQGFVRVGTENTIYESLLGVIAPLIFKNSIKEVKERILEVMVPRIFVNSHFGNLVLEFYNPSDGRAMPATKQELMAWSVKELGITLTSANTYSLIRLYNAFQRFRRFINDPTKRKDLRHIQPLLAEPGLLTTRGIQLIVMEDNGTDPIIIKCPTFGVSMDRNNKNDFAFISRSLKTIGLTNNQYARYELFLHTSNKAAKGGEAAIHETIIEWTYSSRSMWPLIVKTRVDEYMNQCQSRYRSVYSSQQGVNPMSMLPLSKAVEASPFRPEGIVKDHYNHIVGVTFRIKAGHAPYLVILPVVDDGIISISVAFAVKNIYLDWEDVKKAPVEDVIRYYRENLEPVFSLYPGYRIKNAVRQRLDNRIVAVQLENGIYVPVGEPKQDLPAGTTIVDIDELEWELNKQLTGTMPPKKSDEWDETLDQMSIEKRCGMDEELIRTSSDKELEEWYEQFRLMVSNWITSQKAGTSVRKGIEEIIFRSDLPEYERRKRLYIFISSLFLSWFYPDPENWERGTASLLRKDCRLIDQDACTGSCYWKEDERKCLLHVTEKAKLGDRMVSTPELFTKRIIDELVRFPARRKQLMTNGEVSKISKILQPIHDGDQYIIPEVSTTWTNLLRLDWTRQVIEEKKYYEEMSREEDEADKVVPKGDMPPLLTAILGEDTPFRLNVPEEGTLMPFTGILGVTLEQLDVEYDATSLTQEQMVNYVRITSKPIGIINLKEEPIIQFVRPATGQFNQVTILVFLPDQIGILVERDGDATVRTALLPEAIQKRWEEAGIVTVKRRQVKIEEEPPVPIIIGQNPVQQPVIPLVAQKGKEASLVVAPIREKIEEIKVPRKKRIVKIEENEPAKPAAKAAAKPRRKVVIED